MFLDLYFYFEGHDSRQGIIETMREYNEFFRFTPHAYFISFSVYIAGVFENRRDTINFRALIRDMIVTGDLQSSQELMIEALMAKAKSSADKVTILRHNAFAHRTSRMSYDDVFRLAKVSLNELRELTDLALDLFNALATVRGQNEQHFTTLPIEDAEDMMRALAKVSL
ncbi:hypothetical protein UNPA324_33880 [Bradyrhizobium sp. UNPA324]|nr:hypothetical protein UNPA324_33880 [Bradyrhizobium sp. UNPA324]